MNSATKLIVSIGSIAVIATAGIGGFLLATAKDDTSAVASTTTSSVIPVGTSTVDTTTIDTSSSTTSASPTSASSYKDGVYTATASYSVPRSSNSISATVTVSGGKITAVTANDSYSDGESAMYIDSFESSVSGSAVGTSLADATFSRIGGASLTTEGFNSVLDSVRTQATT